MVFDKPPPREERYQQLSVPCGGCIGCRTRKARDWAIRCSLELREHERAAWVTLTYDDGHLVRPFPDAIATLYKPHLSAYVKRLRERVRSRQQKVRFFAVGEYGDRTHRPHYHAILFGVAPDERHLRGAWPFGLIDADEVTPRNIAYTAGYAQKKLRPGVQRPVEYVDPDTGEVFEWQEPFRLVSRNPGIGGAARRFARSWRTTAIHNGKPVPVPRYLHNAWREQATDDEIAQLEVERWQSMPPLTFEQREAGEVIAQAQHRLNTERRSL